MKRLVGMVAAAVLCGSLLVQGVAGAHPQAPSAGSIVYQMADGVWVKREAAGTFMYLAGGMHLTNLANQKSRTLAFVDRSKCAVAKSRNFKMIACAGSARGKRIDPEQFQFDPTMQEARLRYLDNRVEWKGEGVPEAWGAPAIDPSYGAIGFASVDRYAAASGRVLGQRFTGDKWSDMGTLSQGAFAGVFLDTQSMTMWMDDDGLIQYRFTFKRAV